jgi:hypothetical protein
MFSNCRSQKPFGTDRPLIGYIDLYKNSHVVMIYNRGYCSIDDLIIQVVHHLRAVNRIKENIINIIFQEPFENLPLLINEASLLSSIVVNWRLEIGK